MARYASPFGGDGYDTGLSATSGFLDRYMQYMQMRSELKSRMLDDEYRRSLMSHHRAKERQWERESRDTTKPFSPSELEKVYEGMGNFPDANAIYNPTGSEVRRRQLEAMPRGEEEEGPGWGERALAFARKAAPLASPGTMAIAGAKALWPKGESADKSMRETALAAEEWASGGTKTLDLAKPGGEPLIPTGSTGQYELGQTIYKGGQRYKVVGFDEDGEPLVEAY